MRNPAFHKLLEEIAELHNSKNADYATDADPLKNFRRSEAFGITPIQGILIRMSDKWSRIENLSGGQVPKHESLRDSLIDNAVYSLLAVMLLDEQHKQNDGFERTAFVTGFSIQHGYVLNPRPAEQGGSINP